MICRIYHVSLKWSNRYQIACESSTVRNGWFRGWLTQIDSWCDVKWWRAEVGFSLILSLTLSLLYYSFIYEDEFDQGMGLVLRLVAKDFLIENKDKEIDGFPLAYTIDFASKSSDQK